MLPRSASIRRKTSLPLEVIVDPPQHRLVEGPRLVAGFCLGRSHRFGAARPLHAAAPGTEVDHLSPSAVDLDADVLDGRDGVLELQLLDSGDSADISEVRDEPLHGVGSELVLAFNLHFDHRWRPRLDVSCPMRSRLYAKARIPGNPARAESGLTMGMYDSRPQSAGS